MFDLRTLLVLLLLDCVSISVACRNDGPTPFDSDVSDRAGSGAASEPDLATAGSTMSLIESAPPRASLIASQLAPCANAGPPRAGTCSGQVSGIYGVKLELDVWWLDARNVTSPMFDPGRAKLTIFTQTSLGELCQDAAANGGERACGLRFPAVYAHASGDIMQLTVPDAAWDSPDMPSFTTRAHASGLEASDTVVVDPITALFGIALNDAEAAWPAYNDTPFIACADGVGAGCFPDQDGDGLPGITAWLRMNGDLPTQTDPRPNGWHYAPAATDPSPQFADAGATRLYLGLRTRLSASHPIGAACQGGVAGADASDVELRVLDCTLKNGAKCSAAAATFVDQNVPMFHVLKAGEAPPASWKDSRATVDARLDRSASVGPRATVLRLGELDAPLGCEDVRRAFEPDDESR